MDAVFFSMKRAHLGAERLGRWLLKEFSLTPARFDLLNTIVDCEVSGELMTQAELWKRLGVVRSAVCEMLKELLELKIVKRYRERPKARTWIIRLTDLGNGVATQWADSMITSRMDIDPMPIRHEWTQRFFWIGAELGNWVKRNTDLYIWDIEELYASLITPEDGETWGDVPWMDEKWIEENSVEMVEMVATS